ncbi:recombinase family protein (plasmid) [Macrococcoides bohemicum]|uniref:recombinase family protein n=1 Tax=Macrococcoides bohemicum TaxID=1903056 RepID=UPI003AFFF555
MKLGYARVSTTNQSDSLNKQIELLKEDGVDSEYIFKEMVTGTSTAQRSALRELQKMARKGDEIVVTKIDRLARSISDLNNIVTDFNERGISVRFIKDNLYFESDSKNSINTLLFNILGSFAQFERDLIVERTSEGRERAKKEGKHMGRKPSSTKAQINKAIKLHAERDKNGLSVADILKMTSVKKSTFYNELKKHQMSDPE